MLIECVSPETDEVYVINLDLTLRGLREYIEEDNPDMQTLSSYDYDRAVQDLVEIRKFNKKVLPFVVKILNRHLNVELSLRSWQILLGHWLLNFSKALFYRVSLLNEILEGHKVKGIRVVDYTEIELSPIASSNFVDQCLSISWNEKIFLEILSHQNFELITKINVSGPAPFSTTDTGRRAIRYGGASRPIWKRTLLSFSKIYNAVVFWANGPVFFYTQIPFWQRVKLSLLSGTLPSNPSSVGEPKVNEQLRLRKKLGKLLVNELQGEFQEKISYEYVYLHMLFLCLPRSFLEGFEWHRRLAESSLYPKYPEYIFLCNGFMSDPLSFYVAKQVASGTPYIVGQHGGHYGLSKLEMSDTVEERTADAFLTWGHKNSIAPVSIPAFNWKKKLSLNTTNFDDHIVLVTRPPFPNTEQYSVAGWYRKYVESIATLVRSLDDAHFCRVIIRIHPSGAPEVEKSIWARELPGIYIDDCRN